jgi:serine/threonine protein kinase
MCRLLDILSPQRGRELRVEIYIVTWPLAEERRHDISLSEMSSSDRLLILEDCLKGLAYVYSKIVVHRDIKLSNIVVQPIPPKVIIIDFGTATTELQSRDHLKGTIRTCHRRSSP